VLTQHAEKREVIEQERVHRLTGDWTSRVHLRDLEWLAHGFILAEQGEHPKLEMKVAWVWSEKSCLSTTGA
jgi:hypothetical protein